MIFEIRAIAGAPAFKLGEQGDENYAEFWVGRAKSEAEARGLAAGICGDEGSAPWFDPAQTRAVIWSPDGPSGTAGAG